ncbi:MAG: hypothetical protein NT076_05375 [Candidatus Pacearchaeota archaeon]|nr:hypothetical protein [Candidatus Pacearchaeota archaeon]
MKKGVLVAILIISFLSFAYCQGEKIDVSLIKESFSPGENISFRVSLLDKDNNPIQAEVGIILQDAEKINEIQATVNSNELASVYLGNKALSGYWRIIASYNDNEATRIFSIETQEIARFEIQGDKLVITNTGNTNYIQTIQILIGDTIGTKDIALGIGESTSFRLIAPDGDYNIRVSDGKISIMKENVVLSGNVVGILDEKLLEPSSITGGIKTEKGLISSFKNNAVVYIFLLLVICAFILVVIERRYRRKMLGR